MAPPPHIGVSKIWFLSQLGVKNVKSITKFAAVAVLALSAAAPAFANHIDQRILYDYGISSTVTDPVVPQQRAVRGADAFAQAPIVSGGVAIDPAAGAAEF
jgi:predicted lipid-binding transport protein (Tim44 family)